MDPFAGTLSCERIDFRGCGTGAAVTPPLIAYIIYHHGWRWSLGGWISDRLTRSYGKPLGRCFSASTSTVLAAVFVALGTHVGDARLASVVLAGGAGALYLSQSAFWPVSCDIGGRSAGSGVMNMGGQLGGATTASLTPFVAKHFGWEMSFWVAAGLCFMGAVAWLMVDPDQQLKSTPMSRA